MVEVCNIISDMKNILSIALVFLFSSCTGVVFQPSKKLYYSPETSLKMTPDSYDIPIAESVTLHAWRFQSKEKTKGVVIQFHGNAENISSHYLSVAWLLNYGYDVFTFDYRGYGQSTGLPSFPEVVTDTGKVFSFVNDLYKNNPVPVIICGQSLGSVIANNALVRYKPKIDAVIMEGGIYSLNNVSADVLSRHWLTWSFQGLGYVLMSHKYNFKKIAQSYPDIPTLLLHSKKDPVIPFEQSEKIHKALPHSCLKLVDEPTHIGIGNLEKGKYRSEILRFLDHKKCE
jgi:alpha-beta hydrolase superfamily lysophospholipase